VAWPSQTWSWHPPIAGQQPWAQAFQTFVDEVDLSVASAYNHLANRVTSAEAANGKTTLVLSVYPSATLTITGSSGTIAGWTVMSVSPFGRMNGSFSVTQSGTNVLFNLGLQGFLGGAAPAVAGTTNTLYFRGVIQSGSISIPSGAISTTNESGWRHAEQLVASPTRFNSVAVVSLGIGAYTVEMQMRHRPTTGTSEFQMGTNQWLLLTATQVGR
jgi:hypothetical protein